MKPEDANEQTIFDAALQIPDAQARAAYLDSACAGDAFLRERVERLLQASQRADEFLAQNPLGDLIPSLSRSDGETETGREVEGPGTVIGNYKLLEKLGEGGFGVVYMAEQKQPIKRRVALKIIKIGMDTREVVARFEAERQALALMDHPNIAKVFDAGATEATVAAGVPPAAEPGFQPGGISVARSDAPEISRLEPGGKMPPSTAGRMPAATLSAGRPYFVMELVRGIKITDYCDEKHLSTRERLDLFTQVCQAVQHAHQKGIIHRDLKPSNILVTVNDGMAVPKIIDFGIAKATQLELTEKTVFTRFHQFLGTPAYMSPEQAELTSVDIDTRSDIYSLGVLLYELLTGKTPFDTHALLKAGLDEMRRTIREVEPVKPSTWLTQELSRFGLGRRKVAKWESEKAGSAATPVEQSHSPTIPPAHFQPGLRLSAQELQRLIPVLRGDLDWIVMKCLEKDRARRYETANGLASDIQRHLNNEPVAACPPSNLYKFQKLVRRNRVAFAAGAGIAAALVIGLAIALWQSIEKTRAYNRAVAAEKEQVRLRQQAQIEAAKSWQVAQFFEEMLAGAGPEVAKGRDATILKEILNQTARRIETELANQPAVEAYLLERIGNIEEALGDYPAAELMGRRLLALRRQLHPGGHRNVGKALHDLAMSVMHQGRLSEAESLAREALEIGKTFPSTFPEDVPAQMNNLAIILRRQGKFAEAETLHREALTLNRKLLGNEHREVAATLNNLAIVLGRQDKEAEAEAVLREALDMSKKLFGNDHPFAAQALTSLTVCLKQQDRLQEAEATGREAVAMQERLLGVGHPNVALAIGNLALVLDREGNLPEAEAMHRQALAIRRKALGNEHAMVASSLVELGRLLGRRGDLAEAEIILRECLDVTRKLPPNEYVDLEKVYFELVKILCAEGKMSEAQEFFEEAQPLRKDLK